jgi:uncharacterized membrane-anchored protein YitT (DUF2179 family)
MYCRDFVPLYSKRNFGVSFDEIMTYFYVVVLLLGSIEFDDPYIS